MDIDLTKRNDTGVVRWRIDWFVIVIVSRGDGFSCDLRLGLLQDL